MKNKFFICSDIHSFFNEWQQAMGAQGFDASNPNHIVVVLGDLFDRGPDAFKCFEFVKDMANQKRLIYIRGNHEDLLEALVEEIIDGRRISYHHISNKTLDTVSQLTDINPFDLQLGFIDRTYVEAKMNAVLAFFNKNCLDHYEVGRYVFVHGWVPQEANGAIPSDWRERGDWARARWTNGMEQHALGHKLPDKTIICGHWHCSYGYHLNHPECEDIPPKSAPYFNEAFLPYAADGIIAIDACTAHTGRVNCVCLEI